MNRNQTACSTDQIFCALIASPLFIMILKTCNWGSGRIWRYFSCLIEGLWGNIIIVLQSSVVLSPCHLYYLLLNFSTIINLSLSPSSQEGHLLQNSTRVQQWKRVYILKHCLFKEIIFQAFPHAFWVTFLLLKSSWGNFVIQFSWVNKI